MLMGIESLKLKVSFSQKFLFFYYGPNRALSVRIRNRHGPWNPSCGSRRDFKYSEL